MKQFDELVFAQEECSQVLALESFYRPLETVYEEGRVSVYYMPPMLKGRFVPLGMLAASDG
jgi:hypothetical protein